ncbi:hypothetical protein VTL71DRAFT_7499 [Oculimacula yallundae]|uniref:Uncharacterized protein n=1 Tax=Oculimacula yallundae TaxID=86028 RepID=A0ABR4BUD2_9HELO
MLSFGLSHVWLSFCNLSIFALTICILASCRSSSESKYSLINIDKAFLTTAFGENCANASNLVPDVYKVGLSGACRVTDGTINCKSHLPPSLNWIKLLEADLTASNTTGSQASIKECMTFIKERGVDHGLNNRLAIAILALLTVSILLNLITLLVALLNDSAFSTLPFIPALLDEVILVVCLGLYLGIINHEVGDYVPNGDFSNISDISILGVGFWMLLAIFCLRAISIPALFVLTIVIIVSIPIACISLLLCCFGGGSKVSETTVWVYEVVSY